MTTNCYIRECSPSKLDINWQFGDSLWIIYQITQIKHSKEVFTDKRWFWVFSVKWHKMHLSGWPPCSNPGQWHLFGAGDRAGCPRPPCQSRAHVTVHRARWGFTPPAAPRAESPPGVQGFPGPDPGPRSDAYQEAHKVFQHEHCIVRSLPVRVCHARTVVRNFPCLSVMLLVKVTRHYDSGWDCV